MVEGVPPSASLRAQAVRPALIVSDYEMPVREMPGLELKGVAAPVTGYVVESLEELTIAGFEVIGQARNGREAVSQVVALGPDAVTMDFNMPELNGVEAVREIFGMPRAAIDAGAIDVVVPLGELAAHLRYV